MELGRLAITPGEPAGIGPDLLLEITRQELPFQVIAVADPRMLEDRARLLGLPLKITDWSPSKRSPAPAGELYVKPVETAAKPTPGKLDPANGPYVIETLVQAVNGCQNGLFHGMVTGPVQKSVINNAGIPFTGHTEFLAQLTNTPQVVMMLATKELRVALLTTHLPLSKVSAAITKSLLSDVLHIIHRDFQQYFGVQSPHLLVCGLNPHAGENGYIGQEEQETIIPTLKSLREQGLNVKGPYPADTVFTPKYMASADAVVAMYHDQGLPVLKHMGFGRAVNITLGLPIIRTSVDHGTALDLAGSGKADAGSLKTALRYAFNMASSRHKPERP